MRAELIRSVGNVMSCFTVTLKLLILLISLNHLESHYHGKSRYWTEERSHGNRQTHHMISRPDKSNIISAKYNLFRHVAQPKFELKRNFLNAKLKFKQDLFNAKRRVIQPIVDLKKRKINFLKNILQHKLNFLSTIFG